MKKNIKNTKLLIILLINGLLSLTEVKSQCNGPPQYILPENSTGNLAVPTSNLDPITGTWRNDNFYPVSVTCTWILKAPPLHAIYLKILFFSTEENFDFVTLYVTEDRSNQLFRYSGELKEIWEAVTPGNTLVVDFISDDMTTHHGFHFVYMYLPQACVDGGVEVNEDQLIALPPWNLQGVLPGPSRPEYKAPLIDGTPLSKDGSHTLLPRWTEFSPYPQGLNCTWFIPVESDQVIEIEVLKFHTDVDDFLQIFSFVDVGLQLIYTFVDQQIPTNLIHSSRPLILNFDSRTEERGINSGFLLNVTYIDRGCKSEPEILSSAEGYIGYPKHNFQRGHWLSGDAIYYGPGQCIWVIEAPSKYQINVTILHLETREENLLMIKEFGVPLFKYGGVLPSIHSILSSNSRLEISFNSSSDSKKSGFLIYYKWIIEDCVFILNPTNESEILSPFYPESYSVPLHCLWTIIPPDGHQTYILIYNLKLDGGDFLQISDNEDKEIVYTNSFHPTKFLIFSSGSTNISVRFSSDDKDNNGFFLLKFETYQPGNCDFSLSICGWKTIDHLQAWKHNSLENMLVVRENPENLDILPRGYNAEMISPLIAENHLAENCLSLTYMLSGHDTHILTIHIDIEGGTQNYTLLAENVNYKYEDLFEIDETSSYKNKKSTEILQFHGPQGNIFLNVSKNIPRSQKSFRIRISYRRGYGPHYMVAIKNISLTNCSCPSLFNNGKEIPSMLACPFNSTFCRWENSESDYGNWQIDDGGVKAFGFMELRNMKRTSHLTESKKQQHADLVSPSIERGLFLEQNGTIAVIISYKIDSNELELKLILKPHETPDSDFPSEGFRMIVDEFEIWSQGLKESPRNFLAVIPINLELLPKHFYLILRAVATISAKPFEAALNNFVNRHDGVLVRNLEIQQNVTKRNHIDCNFKRGFCSWKVITNNPNIVWNIKDEKNETFAFVSSNGAERGTTKLISANHPCISPNFMSFRYRLEDTYQCLKITVNYILKNELPTRKDGQISLDLWQQCKSKGNHWLKECIEIPNRGDGFQLVISGYGGTEKSIIYIDDIQLTETRCLNEMEGINIWKCNPSRTSLCGMTQPILGIWQWEFQSHSEEIDVIRSNAKLQEKSSELAEGRKQFYLRRSFKHKRGEKIKKTLDFSGEHRQKEHNSSTSDLSELKQISDVLQTPFQEPHRQIYTMECPNGFKLTDDLICDGFPDCENGLDENNCDLECPDGTFKCGSGILCSKNNCPSSWDSCLPWHAVCDGRNDCEGAEDEKDCNLNKMHRVTGPNSEYSRFFNKRIKRDVTTPQWKEKRFECSKGLLIPLSFLCDGRKDCPLDGLDEVGCFHCKRNEYLCPKSGECLPAHFVCDDSINADSCIDEEDCYECPYGHLVCDACIPSERICDGVWDCDGGEDETRCNDFFEPNHHNIHTSLPENIEQKSLVEKVKGNMKSINPNMLSPLEISKEDLLNGEYQGCLPNYFRCTNYRCIVHSSLCDRIKDCPEGEDEKHCSDDNTEEKLFITARRQYYTIPKSKNDAISPSYLLTPVLNQQNNELRLLSFKYRLDSWMGPSNITLSIELLNHTDFRRSLLPWALWRQSGHKGTHWQKVNVLLPYIPGVNKYKIGFLLSGRSYLNYRSEQIHLSRISIKNLADKDKKYFDLKSFNCNFKGSFCGWTQPYIEDGYSWVYSMTSTHSRRTGPITGFAGEGELSGFLFADSLYGREGSLADLISPPLRFNSEEQIMCLRFAAFLYGVNVRSLSVNIMQIKNNSQIFTYEAYNIKGSRGLSWILIDVPLVHKMLSESFEPFSIIFRSVKGPGNEADIAIDNVSITNGNCSIINLIKKLDYTNQVANISSSHIQLIISGPSTNHRWSIDQPLYKTAKKNESIKFTYTHKKLTADECDQYNSCLQCLSNILNECAWCSKSRRCGRNTPSFIKNCSYPVPVEDEKENEEDITYELSNCPIIVSNDDIILIAADETVSVELTVTNIPISAASERWFCNFIFNYPEEKSSTYAEISRISLSEKDKRKKKIRDSTHSDEIEKRKKVFQVQGKFQESETASIICGDGISVMSLKGNAGAIEAKIEIQSENGIILDSQENNIALIYRCSSLSSDCKTCLRLSKSVPCGWCSALKICTKQVDCKTHLWHAQSIHEINVCKAEDEISTLTRLSENELKDYSLSDESFENKPMRKVSNEMKKMLINVKNEKTASKNVKEEIIKNIDGHLKLPEEKKKSEKSTTAKQNKRVRRKGFLRIPIQEGIFMARDVWRLHTGKQYYIPVEKRTLINLGFIRYVNFGSLNEEKKSRTLLMDGSWKKAAGFFIDLFEKSSGDPVTSIITTKENTYSKLLKQILPENN